VEHFGAKHSQSHKSVGPGGPRSIITNICDVPIDTLNNETMFGSRITSRIRLAGPSRDISDVCLQLGPLVDCRNL